MDHLHIAFVFTLTLSNINVILSVEMKKQNICKCGPLNTDIREHFKTLNI